MSPTVLIFDSGLGGLSVLDEVRTARPDAALLYLADDAAFPYGPLPEPALVARVVEVVTAGISRFAPDLVVIACNTASTLVLPPLRAAHAAPPFVGTVPAVKPAALLSRTRRFSVLATPGTVRRDYTRDLIQSFAGDCAVDLVGAAGLAALAERALRGEAVADEELLAEIAPAFVEADGRRTDVVVLACTHFPLLLRRLERLAPWDVAWINPAPAIARRVVQLIGETPAGAPVAAPGGIAFTSGRVPEAALTEALGRRALLPVAFPVMPFARPEIDSNAPVPVTAAGSRGRRVPRRR